MGQVVDAGLPASSLITFMGQGVEKRKTGQQFFVLSIQLKTNADNESGSGPLGDSRAEMSRFTKFTTYIQAELNEDEFGSGGSLTQNLIVKLRDGMAIVNPPYKNQLSDEERMQN